MLKIKESEFQQQVIEMARLFGYIVAHFRPAQTSKGWRTPVSADGKGFPDLVMVNVERRRVIFAELKSEKGKLTAEQELWFDHLNNAGAEVYVWRPNDFDEIEKILRR